MIGVDCPTPDDLQITWQQPACWEVDPEVFFGPADSSEGGRRYTWERRALAVCGRCPVMAACRATALEFPADEQYGVIGGMTAGQRRAVLQRSGRGPGQVPRPRTGDHETDRQLLGVPGARDVALGAHPMRRKS